MERFAVTRKGLELLEDELRHAKTVERPKIIKEIATAREFGDLSENAEYKEARSKQSFLETRISDLENKVSRAQIIDIEGLSGDRIKFGAMVELVDVDTEKTVRYHILGEYEADISKGRISVFSPIARALIGKSVGDVIEVVTPGGQKTYEIEQVNFIEPKL